MGGNIYKDQRCNGEKRSLENEDKKLIKKAIV